jgi:hypothetical protein
MKVFNYNNCIRLPSILARGARYSARSAGPITCKKEKEIIIIICLHFLYNLYVHSQVCSHNLQNMVHYNYIVLISTLCCPLDAGFRLRENAAGELELLSGQKFPHKK